MERWKYRRNTEVDVQMMDDQMMVCAALWEDAEGAYAFYSICTAGRDDTVRVQ